MKSVIILSAFWLASYLLQGLAAADDPRCQIQLEQSQTHALLVDESRDRLEKRLAEAIRANHELTTLYEQEKAKAAQAQEALNKLSAEKKETP